MTIRREDLDAGQVDLSGVIIEGEPEAPVHPGRILADEWLEPLGLSAYRLAKDIRVPSSRLSEILNGRRAITAETALRLARYFGTDGQSWLNLQAAYDMETARRAMGHIIDTEVQPRRVA